MYSHLLVPPEQPMITGHVEAFTFDAKKIKTYEDYRKEANYWGPVFPCQNHNNLLSICIDHREGPNKIVDVGIKQLIDTILGSNTNYPSHCQNGSGTTAVAAGDTDLETAIGSRIAINYKYRSGLSAKFDTFFTENDENGTWAESALFTAVTAGIMLCRKLYAASFTKNTSKTATVTWTWTLASS